LKNVFDEAILAALEPPEPIKKRRCNILWARQIDSKTGKIKFPLYKIRRAKKKTLLNDTLLLTNGIIQREDGKAKYWWYVLFASSCINQFQRVIIVSIILCVRARVSQAICRALPIFFSFILYLLDLGNNTYLFCCSPSFLLSFLCS
jgi:hypothetical protein